MCQDIGFQQIATVDPVRIENTTPMLSIPRRTAFRIHDSIPRFRELLGNNAR